MLSIFKGIKDNDASYNGKICLKKINFNARWLKKFCRLKNHSLSPLKKNFLCCKPASWQTGDVLFLTF